MTDPTAVARIADLATAFWDEVARASPLTATVVGDHRFDDRLDDPSPAAAAAHRASLADLRDRARGVDPSSLDPSSATTRNELIGQIDARVAMLDADVERWSVNPIDGPQIAGLNIEAFQRVDTPADGERTVARWRAMGPWFDQHAANLRAALAEGLVASRSPVRSAIEEIDTILATPHDELALLAPARVDHPDWPSGDLRRFRDGLRDAVDRDVLPALRRYHATLTEEILPAVRPEDHPGILHVPGGAAAYEALITAHNSLAMSAEEIHRLGLAEAARIDEEMAELTGRVLGERDRAAAVLRLRTDPAYHFETAGEIVGSAERALRRAEEAVPAWFGRVPVAGCVVHPMAAYEEEHSSLAYYRDPAADGSRPGVYFVNTSHPGTRPRFEAEVLAFHESVPGHHLQVAAAQELPDLPAFRRFLGPTAFTEGWGLYSERLADDMGLYTSDLDRIGIVSFDSWRAGRLVVDTGLHALGWTRDQAIAFLVEHTALGENNIVNEVDRYIAWPGQALGYKLGQLEFVRLREAARSTLGAAFDIRDFHDVVLGEGAVGLETLRATVAGWVAQKTAAAPA